jgi:DNA polymerase-1
MTLNLTPVFSTTNKVARWEELDSQVQSFSRPSTDKTCCGILSGKHPYAKRLYQLTIINQVLKTVFGKNSLLHYCNADGRIRTFLSPTLKTGRFSSSKPNLQNLSKRRDEEYSELIGEPIKLRSMLVPSPGHAIIMADLVSAELLALAIMSGDEVLLDHCRRSALPETDSNHYDIHSNLAVRAFNLDCEPTKKGLKSIGKLHLRTAAKAIIYGCNYGRSLETIKTEIESQGLSVTLEEVARLKDTMYQMYPKTATLLQSLMEAPYHRKFIRTYHGRCKRFTTATNKIVLSAQSRESANFPFQATVADIMTLWMYNLWLHPQKAVLQYKLLLPIHDELWVEVPEANVEPTINLMQNLILELKLPSWSLDGSPLSDAIYHFDIDTTVVKNS